MPNYQKLRSTDGLKPLLGKTVQSVEAKYHKMIQMIWMLFVKIPGQEIRAKGRRGKYPLVLSDLDLVSLHRMEGKYFFIQTKSLFKARPCLLFTY